MSTYRAIPADLSAYRCSGFGCGARPIIVTVTEGHGAINGWCGDHAPDSVAVPLEALPVDPPNRERTLTTYRLTCGHTVEVPGPHGATTGRAWCPTCVESVAVAP